MNETLDFNATDNIVPENEPSTTPEPAAAAYKEEDIRTLDWREHIRLRPGMYIGKLGDGSYNDDGIYVLLKEVYAAWVMNYRDLPASAFPVGTSQ